MKLKRYKLNIVSRCLISLKPPKSTVTMNHSQQLELSLGKRTELICTPNTFLFFYIFVKIYSIIYVQVSCKYIIQNVIFGRAFAAAFSTILQSGFSDVVQTRN